MGPDLWAFIAVSIVAIVLLILALCDAAGSADNRLNEIARRRDGDWVVAIDDDGAAVLCWLPWDDDLPELRR